ncbi:hypothetical protein F5X99DRAFT_382700 [Biscogniauxia marginata]|nr:hypothetical protein F5X99DRAFT_382700 [Biscogniauxia marginata]
MSLGVKSLWRAQSCTSCVKGLSLILRESRCLLSPPRPTRRWLSAAVGRTEPPPRAKISFSSHRRRIFRRIIKQRSELGPKKSVLVRRPEHYPNNYETRRSLRKHQEDVARQHLHDQTRETEMKPPHDWRSTLDFMLRHTPKFGEVLDFKVVIGKGAAEDARELLSGPDTNLEQIRRKHSCEIRIEETSPHDNVLVLSLSGSEISLRKSLLELVRVVGKLTAVRGLDTAGKLLLSDVWEDHSSRRLPVKLLGEGEVGADETTMTVSRDSVGGPLWAAGPRYKSYVLTQRADHIPRPAEWTEISFEAHVAALVYGRVPTHLAQQLYPNGANHQKTVVSLLLDLFTSQHTQSVISVSSLKLALKFMQSKGTTFRPDARALFYQAELLNLPLDTETFNAFLVGASKLGDLDGFNSVLRTMVRKRYFPQSHTWMAFLDMIEDPEAKRYIINKMRAKGLNRLPSVLSVMGSHTAVLDLEHRLFELPMNFDILLYVDEQDKKYGTQWLNPFTLNRIIDILGNRGKQEACQDLINSICFTRRTTPDVYTLNTLITHSRSIRQKIRMMVLMKARWPLIRPDEVTYHQLFRAAWRQRLPNMLRVIWRYAVLAKATNSKMRRSLVTLLRQRRGVSKQRDFLKAWEDVIFFRAELTKMRALQSKYSSAAQMLAAYFQAMQGRTMRVSLTVKLRQAYDMDMKIHRLIKEGTVISTSMKRSLTVNIPLKATNRLKVTERHSTRTRHNSKTRPNARRGYYDRKRHNARRGYYDRKRHMARNRHST